MFPMSDMRLSCLVANGSRAVARLSRRAPGRWLDISSEPSLTVGLLPRTRSRQAKAYRTLTIAEPSVALQQRRTHPTSPTHLLRDLYECDKRHREVFLPNHHRLHPDIRQSKSQALLMRDHDTLASEQQ